MPAELRKSNMEILQTFFAEADPRYKPEAAIEISAATLDQTKSGNITHQDVSAKKRRRYGVDTRHTQTVASAAEWIDAVTRSPYQPKKQSAISVAQHLYKIVQMAITAKKLGS